MVTIKRQFSSVKEKKLVALVTVLVAISSPARCENSIKRFIKGRETDKLTVFEAEFVCLV